MNDLNIEYNNVEVNNYEATKAGLYEVKIDTIESRTSKAGNAMIFMSFEFDNGQLHFENLNIGHPKDTVRGMALRSIKSIFTNLGMRVTYDTFDEALDALKSLEGKEVALKITWTRKKEIFDDDYNPNNEEQHWINFSVLSLDTFAPATVVEPNAKNINAESISFENTEDIKREEIVFNNDGTTTKINI